MSIAETKEAIEKLDEAALYCYGKPAIRSGSDLKALAASHTRLLKAVTAYCVEPAPVYEDSFEGSLLAVADMEVEKAELIAAVAEAEKS